MSDSDSKHLERLDAFEKELTADPRSLVFVALAEEHNRIGNFEQAATVAQKGLVYHPDSVAGRLALALAEAGRNNIRPALEQIKRALLIDPENPKALALMGRILLHKGLARRAIQFLTHAVKLDPDEPEYGDLLKRARKIAQTEPEPPTPVFRAEAVPDAGSPWTEDDSSDAFGSSTARPSDAEHTVFHPDTANASAELRAQGGRGPDLDALPRALPQDLGDEQDDAEPTLFSDGEPRRAGGDRPPPRRAEGAELPREDAAGGEREHAENPRSWKGEGESPKRKPKVGGSAAEFSQMMQQMRRRAVEGASGDGAAAPPSLAGVDDTEDSPGRRNGVPRTDDLSLGASPAPVSAGSEPPTAAARPRSTPRPSEAHRGEVAPGSPSAQPSGSKPGDAGPAKKQPSSARRSVDGKRSSAPSAQSAPEPVAVHEPSRPKAKPGVEGVAAKDAAEESRSARGVGPASTRMVDEALWALLGGKVESSPEPRGTVPVDFDKKSAEREKAAAESREKETAHKAGGAAKPDKASPVMVVRTSERFGTVFAWSVMFVLVVAGLWIGYALAVAGGGPAPEVAGEEVKGVAGDLERGGLAQLLAAEEKILNLSPRLPQLSDLFTGALAEIYARRYVSFGRDPEMYEKAREKIAVLKNTAPTVELLSAMVVLSTSAEDRKRLDRELARAAEEHPESPKVWVLRARLAALDGRLQDAEDGLYNARSIHPQHRWTLLELARWHARTGAYGAAFAYYDQLQTAYPEDVEVAIDRFVLGQITGRDPAENQSATTLAGLVREELADVAKDEAGRAALAFAVAILSRGELVSGIEELGRADAAFDRSAEFKAALAGLYLATGQWDRARRHYTRAVEIEPNEPAHRLGLTRAAFGERAGLRADPDAFRRTVQSATKVTGDAIDGATKGGVPSRATPGRVIELPFALVRFVPGKFALVNVEPNPEIFPETAYVRAQRTLKGAELGRALETASLVAIADGKMRLAAFDDALAVLEEAERQRDDAPVQSAFGRAYLARKDADAALARFKRAIEMDGSDVQARLGLVAALTAKNQVVEAIEVLEKLERSNVIVPQAMLMLAKLRMKRGDFERAVGMLDAVIEMRPSDPGGYLALGEAQHLLKKHEAALDAFRRMKKIAPKASEKSGAIQLLYFGRLELDRNEKAGIAILRQSLKQPDAPEEARFYLGKALVRSPKTRKEGRRELETFRKHVSSGELYDEAGRLLR